MATVEEVLNDMSTADVIGSAANIEYLIDNELRIITVPQNGVVLGVEGDKDVNVVHFKMPRMYRGLDLGDGFNIRVNYANAKAELGYFAVVRPNVTEDSISFEWLLGSHALMYVGEIKFAVSLIKSSVDGRIEKKFNTTLGKAQCLTGLDVDVSVPEEDIYDLLTQIKQDVMADIQPSLDGAKADAAAAKQSATQATESAATATTGAENVRLGVEAVKDAVKIAEQTSAHVDEVKTAVEASATAASSDAAKAEAAKTAAVTAQGKAEAAKTSAEQFKMAAEQAKDDTTAQALAAAQSAEAAEQAKTEASTSKTAAAQSAEAAEQAKTEASTSKTAAAESAKQAKVSQDAASTIAQTASTKAEEAKTSADAAKVSETNAKASENAATNIVENAKIVSDNVLKGEETATLINVTDAWPSKPRGVKIYGQSNQVTTTGKNIMRLINSGTANGVNLTANGDGSYHVKGAQTAGFTRFYTDDSIKKPLAEFGLKIGDTVYLSAAEASSKLYLAMFFFDETGSNVYTQVATSANVTKYTIAENVTQAYACISLDGSVGTSVDSDFHPMISLNNNKDWEPYTGGKPSPSPEYPQEITNLNRAELVVSGKNLLDIPGTQTINYSNQDIIFTKDGEGYITSTEDDGRVWGYELANIKFTLKAGTYTFSCEVNQAMNGDYGGIRITRDGIDDIPSNFNLRLTTKQSVTFTLESDCKIGLMYKLFGARIRLQLEAGSKATAYTPHQSNSTPIDLKGNELCSLPNGVRDEVVIDAEGNVSLIKRVAKIDASTVNLQYMQKQNNNKWIAFKQLPNITSTNATKGVISSKFIHKYMLNDGAQYGNFTITADGNLCFGIPESFYPKEGDWASVTPEVNAWFDGLKEGLFIYALYKNPQTIPLGKVELPALPEATSNVWNDGNIPANVYIQYLKDVNIAYTDLENQIKQITTALAVTTLEIATK